MVEHEEKQVSLYQGDKKPKKGELVSFVMDKVSLCNYYGHTYIEKDGLWAKLNALDFKSICYLLFGAGIPSSHIRDLEHYFIGSHNILPHPSKYISFNGEVWDMDKCDFVTVPVSKCFFRSEISPNIDVAMGSNQFIKDLSCNDDGVYDDIFYTLSVMFSSQKPDMVGFFYGAEGSNGKSVLIDVVNKIIGNHISSINLERLTDQRDAPLINGTLANLCGENADNIIIEDSQVYKSIGSHERWSVHRMHTNESIEIDTNPLHIFCVNNMPSFKDKSNAIIRRARVVPFKNKFAQNPSFRSNLLNNKEFLSDFLGELLLYCKKGKANGWVADMSHSTKEQIEEYDLMRNSARTFIDESMADELVGFKDFTSLENSYMDWCNANGFTRMGMKNFRSAVMRHNFKRVSDGASGNKIYLLEGYNRNDVISSVGLYYKGVVKPTEECVDKAEELIQDVLELFR